MCVIPFPFSPSSGCRAVLLLEKKGSLRVLLGQFLGRTAGLRGVALRPSPRFPSTHKSFERYAKLAELPNAFLPRQASLQVGFYIYVNQK